MAFKQSIHFKIYILMKKITLSLLFIASIFFVNNALAQQKVEAHGFQLEASSKWKFFEYKGTIHLSTPASDVSIRKYPVRSKEKMVEMILEFLEDETGFDKNEIKKYAKTKNFVKNGLSFLEISAKTDNDRDGFYEWGKVWVTTNKKKTKMILFGAYSTVDSNETTNDIKELNEILNSISTQ